MNIIVLEEPGIPVLFQQFRVKIHFEIKDGALVRYGMGMSDRTLKTWFCYQCASIVRIQRPTKDIEKEISFSYKAYAKRVAVLWL